MARGLHTASIFAVLVGLAVARCASSGGYVNTIHPEYGTTQHDSDLAQCQKENSQMVTIPGYQDRTITQVNEAGARDCMATLGWKVGS
jgi:hypothetical protein